MCKYFDDFGSFHHFFDIAVLTSEILLLSLKVLSRTSADAVCHIQHDCHHDKRYDSQRQRDDDHGNTDKQNIEARLQCLRNALCDDLTQGICIICVDTHDISVRMRIEI